MREILEKHKDEVIKAITSEKNKEIAELKQKIEG
jgi:acyl-CoA reductase-like NAD-dependent aldehyde dehydrogenase